MRRVLLILAAVLATAGMVANAHATPRLSVEVWGASSIEYTKRCQGPPSYTCGTYTNRASFMIVPLVNDGVPEPTENVYLRITGVSVPATIGPRDETLIFDGGSTPVDCDLWRDADSGSVTCTARPAGLQWHTVLRCDHGHDWPNEWTRFYTRYGNTVTGNGTSSADCDAGDLTGDPDYDTL